MVTAHHLFLLTAAAPFIGHAFGTEKLVAPNVTFCHDGAADILGERKAYAVHVCNLFGATCYLNHPSLDADACATEALAVKNGECKLYPIFEYENWLVRSGPDAVEELSSEGDLGCELDQFRINGGSEWTTGFSGACVAVQCSLGDGNFAGPGMTDKSDDTWLGSVGPRTGSVTNTDSVPWKANTVADVSREAAKSNVILYRTGRYIATTYLSWYHNYSASILTVGRLPTSSIDRTWGGSVDCPMTGQKIDSSTAMGITSAELQMCGRPRQSHLKGSLQYWSVMNLMMDTLHSARVTKDADHESLITYIGFLDSGYVVFSDDPMDLNYIAEWDNTELSRKVSLVSGPEGTSDALMTSSCITPSSANSSEGNISGVNYIIVFYCDDYYRTDLTTCTHEHRKIFYIKSPYSTMDGDLSDKCVWEDDVTSGASARQTLGVALFAAITFTIPLLVRMTASLQ